MSYFWLQLRGGKRMCIEAKDELAARTVTEHVTGDPVDKILGTLPYPAAPLVQPSDCPAFCRWPDRCVNKSCCPQDYACTE
jgi:hypothetical protein